MKSSHKGGAFERKIAKELSLWWTYGKREDIFWRSTQSGGRATQRAKTGKTTHGQQGDLAAQDPHGETLLKFATFELKRGDTYGTPWDMLEGKNSAFASCLVQAKRSHELAGSMGWILIGARDRRVPMIYMDWRLYRILAELGWLSRFRISSTVFSFRMDEEDFRFLAIPWESWKESVNPAAIHEAVKEFGKKS